MLLRLKPMTRRKLHGSNNISIGSRPLMTPIHSPLRVIYTTSRHPSLRTVNNSNNPTKALYPTNFGVVRHPTSAIILSPTRLSWRTRKLPSNVPRSVFL